jgi:hypothetical protein
MVVLSLKSTRMNKSYLYYIIHIGIFLLTGDSTYLYLSILQCGVCQLIVVSVSPKVSTYVCVCC